MGRAVIWALGCFAAALLLAVLFHKPMRVLVPETMGLTCSDPGLCVEEHGRLDEARALRSAALAFVRAHIGTLENEPRVLFCSTRDCLGRFTNPDVSGMNVGTFGVVIGPKGWEAHILRHEIIHHWQAETFGLFATAHGLPRWYIEGMAYVLSGDPRAVIPNSEAEGFRRRFAAWLAEGNDWRIPPQE